MLQVHALALFQYCCYISVSSITDPLRPLWPFLGIVGSLIITFLLMIGGTYWDKALRKLTSAPDDEGVCVSVCVCA